MVSLWRCDSPGNCPGFGQFLSWRFHVGSGWAGFDVGLEVVADDFGVVGLVDGEGDQGDAGGAEGVGEEGVAGLSAWLVVGGVVEFDGGDDAGGFGGEQDEVEMFLGDLAAMWGVEVFDGDHVGQADFQRDDPAGADGGEQAGVVEAAFARCEQVPAGHVRQRAGGAF